MSMDLFGETWTIEGSPGPALRGNARSDLSLVEEHTGLRNLGPDDLYVQEVTITGGSTQDPTYTLGPKVTVTPGAYYEPPGVGPLRLSSAGRSKVSEGAP